MPKRPEVNATESKADAVYWSLRGRITDASYSPGHRLVLDQLAQEFNVSTVPVREAVRKLEAEGLVEFKRNVGATVAGIEQDAYDDAMEALAYLEGAATALAAPLLTADDLDRALEINARMRESMQDFDPISFTRLNQEFHELVCSKCPNAHLQTLINREWNQLSAIRRSTFSYVPGRAKASVDEHDDIVRLIREGAPGREIEMAARLHKLGTRQAFDESRASEAGRSESAGSPKSTTA